VKATLVEENGCLKTLEVEFAVEEVEPVRQKVIKETRKIAQVPGFRPGRAPVGLLERRFKTAIHQELMEELLKENLPKTLEEQQLVPVDKPELKLKEYTFGGPLTAVVIFEALPRVELKEYRGLEVKFKPQEFEAQMVAAELERLRQMRAKLTDITDRPAARLDFVDADIAATFADGSEPVVQEHAMLAVEEGLSYSLVSLQFENMAAGEEKEFDLEFPPDYYDSRYAGKQAHVKARLNVIKSRQAPALDDAFAKSVGEFEDLPALRAQLEQNLRAMVEHQNRQRLGRKVIEALVAGYDFPVPKVMADAAFQDSMQSVVYDMAQRGMTDEQIRNLPWGEYRASSADGLAKRVRELILLGEIATKEDITVTDEELEQAIARAAEQHKVPLAEYKQKLLRQEDRLDSMKREMRLEKATRLLVEAARVTAPTPEEEAAEAAQHDHDHDHEGHVHGEHCQHD